MTKSLEDKLAKIPVLNVLVRFFKRIKLPGLEGLSFYEPSIDSLNDQEHYKKWNSNEQYLGVCCHNLCCLVSKNTVKQIKRKDIDIFCYARITSRRRTAISPNLLHIL